MNELPDTADGLEAKETASKIPLGWWALFWGLIVWGVYYVVDLLALPGRLVAVAGLRGIGAGGGRRLR